MTSSPAPPTPESNSLSDRDREYLGAIQDHLSLRGVKPDRVGSHLEEMALHLRDAGADPVQEFGNPGDYAKAIAKTEGIPAWVPWARLVGAYASTGGFMASITWIGHGGAPGQLPLSEFSDAVTIGLVGAGAVLLTGARLRDRLRGVDDGTGQNPPGGSSSAVLKHIGIMVAAIVAMSILTAVFFNDQPVGIASAPAWAVGVGCLIAAAIIGWFSLRPLQRAIFPAGSRLKKSMWRRPLIVD